MSCLGHSVVDHLARNLNGRLAGDENYAAPVLFPHSRQIGTAQTNTTHNIDFEQPEPVFIRNLLEGLDLENSDVVDEDLHFGKLLNCDSDAIRIPEIRGQTLQFRLRNGRPNLLDRVFDSFFGATVHNHFRAFSCQNFGNGISDACG